MKLSVIIPCYKRHELSVRNIEETMKSTYIPDEIVVVNDGGDPVLKEMIKKLDLKTRIVYARINEDILWNYNGAVNLGVWLSKGDNIMIQDTDHIPEKNSYEDSLKILDAQPEISRIAFYRKCVGVSEVMVKPMEEWKVIKTWGSNKMVTILRRDVYLTLKGQDERMAGEYGWFTYDWVNRCENVLKVKSAMVKFFWAVIEDGGEPGMKRGMSSRNYRFYKENGKAEKVQHPSSILNFSYEYEIM